MHCNGLRFEQGGVKGKGSELKNCTVTAKFAWSEVALAGAALLTY